MKLRIAMFNYPTSANGTLITPELYWETMQRLSSDNYDIIACPEWGLFFCKEGRPQLTCTEEKEDLVARLCDLSSNKRQLILPGTMMWQQEGTKISNTLPIVGNGKYYGDHHKHTDGGSEQAIKNTGLKKWKLKRAKEYCATFKWEGLDVATEICADVGYLKYLPFKLDLQFLLACGLRHSISDLHLKRKGFGLGINGLGIANKIKFNQKEPINSSAYQFQPKSRLSQVKKMINIIIGNSKEEEDYKDQFKHIKPIEVELIQKIDDMGVFLFDYEVEVGK